MVKKTLAALFLLMTLMACENKKKASVDREEVVHIKSKPKSLLDNVKLAINPEYENWVLFENGTYIIFDDLSELDDMEAQALASMQAYGPASGGGPAGDFGVVNLNTTEGWVVSGQAYGMYTYVSADELPTNSPDDITIGLYGRSKRDKDSKELKIIHINKSE